jgi:RHS repeat-associated protein
MNRAFLRPVRARPSAVAAILSLLVLGSARSVAAAAKPNHGEAGHFMGGYETAIPIAVPAFHGVEPDLALSYDSSSPGDGFVGPGWSVSGISTITRAGRYHGTPRYDDSDVFLMDGEELVPCAATTGVSPSCLTGGTHASKIESYLRISFDAASDRWFVTRKNGVKARYSVIHPTAQGSFKWGRDLVTDTLGNTASFHYKNAGSDPKIGSYPSSSHYNGVDIFFVWGLRPDPTVGSDGTGLVRDTHRLLAINVFVQDGAVSRLLRSQRIQYVASAATGRSLVQSVRTYGRDATFALDPTQDDTSDERIRVPVAGTFASPFEFTNQAQPVQLALGPINAQGNSIPDGQLFSGDINRLLTGDFNGDGRLDVLRQEVRDVTVAAQSPIRAYLSNADGTFTPGPTDSTGSSPGLGGNFSGEFTSLQISDFNGDGKADILRRREKRGNCPSGPAPCGPDNNSKLIRIYYSNGDGTFTLGPTDAEGNSLSPGVDFIGIVYFTVPNAFVRQVLTTLEIGDFNGDGRADILKQEHGQAASDGVGVVRVYLSKPDGTFALGPTDGAGNSISPGTDFDGDKTTLVVSDYNGDGRADVLLQKRGALQDAVGIIRVFLSNADGTFSLGTTDAQGNAVGPGEDFNGDSASLQVGDFNGDGRADLFRHRSKANPCTGQGPLGPLPCPGDQGYAMVQVYLSKGDGTFSPGPTDALSNSISPGAEFERDQTTIHMGDFNGDTRTDILRQERGAFAQDAVGMIRIYLSKGDGTFTLSPTDNQGNAISPGADFHGDKTNLVVGDFGGRGRTDVLRQELGEFAADGSGIVRTYLDVQGAPDLMVKEKIPDGAETAIAYAPSSQWPSTNNPPVIQTVTSETVSDGRGLAATTTYAYGGGLFDPIERRHLGFHYVKAVRPCLELETKCPYAESWYRQDYGSISKPERVDERDGEGRLLSSTLQDYVTNGAAIPYTSLNVATWSYAYGLTEQEWRRTGIKRAFDAYGNVIQEASLGDVDAEGDDTVTRTSFRPNTNAYIVDRPTEVSIFAGIGGALIQRRLFFYDEQDQWDKPPVQGLPTREDAWLSSTNAFLSSAHHHDSFGNVVAAIDRRGATTQRTLDDAFHSFITKEVNPIGHTVVMTWDVVCGVPLSRTGPNGTVTTFAYDSLCRPTRTDKPGGDFEERQYVAFGDPASQYTESATPGTTASDRMRIRKYHDGLGRIYKTERIGTGSSDILVERADYDARGNVRREAGAHLSTASPPWTLYRYDAADRTVRADLPGGGVQQIAYAVGRVTRTDELGHQETDVFDAHGRITAHIEMMAGQPHTAVLTYDRSGHMTGIVDPDGNVWTFSYDSLGRRLTMSDPDAGSWSYEYDAEGNETAEKDAMGQRTEFKYDLIGRKTSKTTRAGTPSAVTVAWSYDEVRSGAENVGHVTTTEDPSGIAKYDYVRGLLVRGVRSIDGTMYPFQKRYSVTGRLLGTTYPDGDEIGSESDPLTYDGFGRLDRIPGIVEHMTYTAWNALALQQNSNGTVTTRTYDDNKGWLTSLVTNGPAGAIQASSFTRDELGRIKHIASPFPHASWKYGYNELNQLTFAEDETSPSESQTFAYNVIGNMVSNSRVGAMEYPAKGAPRPHAVASVGGVTRDYDGNGNLIRAGTKTFSWSGDNRLIAAEGVTNAYDADGGRIKKTEGNVVTHYVGDDFEVRGGVVTKYVRANGTLLAKRVADKTLWLHTGHDGSVQVVSDSSGAEVQRLAFRPYGELLAATSQHEQTTLYTGQRHDSNGLLFLHARYDEPAVGRFISPDPTIPSNRLIGLNRYAYAGNDPINHTDIDGLKFRWRGVKRAIGKALSHVVSEVAKIKVVGPLLATGLLANPMFGVAYGLSTGDWKSVARAVGTSAVIAASIYSGGALAPLLGGGVAGTAAFVAGNAAIGFVSGGATALINGADPRTAFRRGYQGAAWAAGFAAAQVAQRAVANSNLRSPTPPHARAEFGAGPGRAWYQEQGVLLRRANQIFPDAANISSFVHESIYPALQPGSYLVGANLPSQGLLCLADFLVMEGTQVITLAVATPLVAVQVGSLAATTGASWVFVGSMSLPQAYQEESEGM